MTCALKLELSGEEFAPLNLFGMYMDEFVKSKITDPELVERRRKQIVDAAIVLFGRHGYHVTKMREIADRAGVSIGLIYQYFEDKEDVLFLALLEVLDSYLKEIPAAVADETEPLTRFRNAVHAYCKVNDANTDATVLAYRETKSLSVERRNLIKQKEIETNEVIASFVRECIDADLFEPVDVELFVYQVVMFSHTWALKAWRFRKLMTVDDYLERGLSILLNATLTPQGKITYHSLTKRSRPATGGARPTQARQGGHRHK